MDYGEKMKLFKLGATPNCPECGCSMTRISGLRTFGCDNKNCGWVKGDEEDLKLRKKKVKK